MKQFLCIAAAVLALAAPGRSPGATRLDRRNGQGQQPAASCRASPIEARSPAQVGVQEHGDRRQRPPIDFPRSRPDRTR